MLTFEQDGEMLSISEPDPDGKHPTIQIQGFDHKSAYLVTIEDEEYVADISLPKNWIVV